MTLTSLELEVKVQLAEEELVRERLLRDELETLVEDIHKEREAPSVIPQLRKAMEALSHL